ncbi:c-type cytochrome [Profundibacter sp.]
MKKIESLLGYLSLAGLLGTAGLAIFVIGNLIFQGSPESATAAVSEPAAKTDTQPATTTTAETPAATPAPVKVAQATPAISTEAGEKVFKKCKACHTIDDGGAKKVGPNLWGIVGRDVATSEGFKYSDAMLGLSGKSWDAAMLDEYLTKPKDFVPGTAMSFSGLKKEADRHNLIAYLAQQSASPLSVADLGFATAAAEATPAAATEAVTEEPAVEEENTFVDSYTNPPARTADEQAAIDAKVAALTAEVEGMDYERARYHPLHFPPMINQASNEECLVCHSEIMTAKPREASPAGVPASDTIAWYQTLATYEGPQETFHYRHLQSDYAVAVMNLQCTFCHKGNDPREESPDLMVGRAAYSAAPSPEFTLRKMVNPSTTCLRCHGAMPDPENIMGLSGPWHESRADFEDEETLNGCLTCHGEYGFRTNRHNVTYLNAHNIEDLATASSDTCYGCHGGRQWYRISYPYPRHPWPDMDKETPDWALARPTASDPEYQRPEPTRSE